MISVVKQTWFHAQSVPCSRILRHHTIVLADKYKFRGAASMAGGIFFFRDTVLLLYNELSARVQTSSSHLDLTLRTLKSFFSNIYTSKISASKGPWFLAESIVATGLVSWPRYSRVKLNPRNS